MMTGGAAWLVSGGEVRRSLWARGGKRAFDAGSSVVLLVVLSPVLVVAGLAVAMTSRGGMIYRQMRIGRGQQPFVMYKFRTMRSDASPEVHRDYVRRLLTEDAPPTGGSRGLYKLEHDVRITFVGRLLRRTSVDELPQLVNVLKGQMALVGPRPALPYEAELFPQACEPRFLVRPGITGLWQVSGRSRLTMLAGLALDVDYVEALSLRTDLAILAKTVLAVCRPGSAT